MRDAVRCFLFVAPAWWLFRLLLSAVTLHGHGVWAEPDTYSLREVILRPQFIRVAVMLGVALAVTSSSLSRRRVADVVHCTDHLCAGVSLFLHRDVLEFTHDVGTIGVSQVAYAFCLGNTPLVCILNLMQTMIFALRVYQSDVLAQQDVPTRVPIILPM